MNINSDTNIKPQSRLVRLIIATGVIKGGCEQVITQLIPLLLEFNSINKLSFERAQDKTPIVQLLIDVDDSMIDIIIETSENMLHEEVIDVYPLHMSPLVDIPGEYSGDVTEPPYGVRCVHADISGVTDSSSLWWELEMILGLLAIELLKLIRDEELDRKDLAVPLLYYLLASNDREKISALSQTISLNLLKSYDNYMQISGHFRRNTHKLYQCGMKILTPHMIKISSHDNIIDLIAKSNDAMRRIPNDSSIHIHSVVWQNLANKIGFTTLESSYIASMLSRAAKEEMDNE